MLNSLQNLLFVGFDEDILRRASHSEAIDQPEELASRMRAELTWISNQIFSNAATSLAGMTGTVV